MGAFAARPGLLALFLSTACNGAPDRTLTAFSTGLDRERALVELTAAERTNSCSNARRWLDVYDREQREPSCRVIAAFFASFGTLAIHTLHEVKAGCRALYDECVSGQGRFHQMQRSRPAVLVCEPIPPSCEATVGMVEDCLAQTHEQLKQLRGFPRCADLTEADVDRSIQELAASIVMPACLQAAARCHGHDRSGGRDNLDDDGPGRPKK